MCVCVCTVEEFSCTEKKNTTGQVKLVTVFQHTFDFLILFFIFLFVYTVVIFVFSQCECINLYMYCLVSILWLIVIDLRCAQDLSL